MAPAPTRSPIQLQRSPGLDGLRAVAVGAVVLYHAGATWLPGGFLGVDVFFVLSGFLVTSLLLAEWRRRRRPRIGVFDFWRRRARRILPALYLLLAAVLLAWLIARPGEVASIRGDAVAAFAYVANWWFLLGSRPYFATAGRPSPFMHLWSLGVEEQYYLVWPLLFMALALLRRWAPWVLLLGAAGSAAAAALLYRHGADTSAVYYNTGTHATGLLLGSALAFWWRPGRRLRRGRGLRRALTSRPFAEALGAGCLAGLVFAFAWLSEDSGLLYQGGMAAVAVLTAVAIVAATHPAAGRIASALAWPPLRWLGTRSYGVYLWHWPLLVLLGRSHAAVAVVATLLVAELSYLVVEMPIRRQGFQLPRLGPLPRPVPAGLLAAGVTALLVVVALTPQPPPPAYLTRLAVDTVGYRTLITTVRAPRPVLDVSESPLATGAPTIPIVAVGDSVMVGAAPALERTIPGIQIDAREGRQVQTGLDVLQQLGPSGRLQGEVVVDLGNNGTFTDDQLSALMTMLSGAERVVFVNLKEDEPWTAANNQLLSRAVKTYANAVLVDWLSDSTPHPEYFWDDGLHLRPQGAQAYAQFIRAALAAPL